MLIISLPASSLPSSSLLADGSRLPTNHRQQVQTNGSLVIGNLQKTDAGVYTCATKDGKKRLRVSLQVIGKTKASRTSKMREG